MGFFTKFFGVEVDKGSDALMTMLIKWDPAGATEAEKRMIAEKLSEFCVKCEDARKKMVKELADVATVKAAAADKVALYEMWDTEVKNPATSEDRRKRLEKELPGLAVELSGFGPRIDKEVREAELAEKLFKTYDQVVIKTNEKLQQKLAQADQQTAELEIAKAEKALLEEQVTAARVLAGLAKATDSFDVAANVVSKETEKLRTQSAGLQREADLLTASSTEDVFRAAELAKMKGAGNAAAPITDQLAALKAKLGS